VTGKTDSDRHALSSTSDLLAVRRLDEAFPRWLPIIGREHLKEGLSVDFLVNQRLATFQ